MHNLLTSKPQFLLNVDIWIEAGKFKLTASLPNDSTSLNHRLNLETKFAQLTLGQINLIADGGLKLFYGFQ